MASCSLAADLPKHFSFNTDIASGLTHAPYLSQVFALNLPLSRTTMRGSRKGARGRKGKRGPSTEVAAKATLLPPAVGHSLENAETAVAKSPDNSAESLVNTSSVEPPKSGGVGKRKRKRKGPKAKKATPLFEGIASTSAVVGETCTSVSAAETATSVPVAETATSVLAAQAATSTLIAEDSTSPLVPEVPASALVAEMPKNSTLTAEVPTNTVTAETSTKAVETSASTLTVETSVMPTSTVTAETSDMPITTVTAEMLEMPTSTVTAETSEIPTRTVTAETSEIPTRTVTAESTSNLVAEVLERSTNALVAEVLGHSIKAEEVKKEEEGEEEEEEVEEADAVPPQPKRRRGNAKKGKKGVLKQCANCGTVAEKSMAKKCHKCKKFFYDHWAQRCRIPPCPRCHFSRKARGRTLLPKMCERCGHTLPSNEPDRDTLVKTGAEGGVSEGNSVAESAGHLKNGNKALAANGGEDISNKSPPPDLTSSTAEDGIDPEESSVTESREGRGAGRSSDDLPQISDMMSNIENATTVIAESSDDLQKSLGELPTDPVEENSASSEAVLAQEPCSQADLDGAEVFFGAAVPMSRDKRKREAGVAWGEALQDTPRDTVLQDGASQHAPKGIFQCPPPDVTQRIPLQGATQQVHQLQDLPQDKGPSRDTRSQATVRYGVAGTLSSDMNAPSIHFVPPVAPNSLLQSVEECTNFTPFSATVPISLFNHRIILPNQSPSFLMSNKVAITPISVLSPTRFQSSLVASSMLPKHAQDAISVVVNSQVAASSGEGYATRTVLSPATPSQLLPTGAASSGAVVPASTEGRVPTEMTSSSSAPSLANPLPSSSTPVLSSASIVTAPLTASASSSSVASTAPSSPLFTSSTSTLSACPSLAPPTGLPTNPSSAFSTYTSTGLPCALSGVPTAFLTSGPSTSLSTGLPAGSSSVLSTAPLLAPPVPPLIGPSFAPPTGLPSSISPADPLSSSGSKVMVNKYTMQEVVTMVEKVKANIRQISSLQAQSSSAMGLAESTDTQAAPAGGLNVPVVEGLRIPTMGGLDIPAVGGPSVPTVGRPDSEGVNVPAAVGAPGGGQNVPFAEGPAVPTLISCPPLVPLKSVRPGSTTNPVAASHMISTNSTMAGHVTAKPGHMTTISPAAAGHMTMTGPSHKGTGDFGQASSPPPPVILGTSSANPGVSANPGSSSFQTLDLTSACSQTGNKIRVSLLRHNLQSSDSQPDSSSVMTLSPLDYSPPPSPTGGTNIANGPPKLLSASSQSPPILHQALPPNQVAPPGSKFQNFAVSPRLSVIATVETKLPKTEQKTDPNAPGLPGKPKSDATDAEIRQRSRSPASSTPPCEPAASSASVPATSNCSSTPGELDMSGNTDLATIDKIASNIQLSVKDTPPLTCEDEVAVSGASNASTAVAKRIGNGAMKILPSGSRPLTPSGGAFSHLRTPGVVTVQVCSSIPGSLTLSSITNSVSLSNQAGGGVATTLSSSGEQQGANAAATYGGVVVSGPSDAKRAGVPGIVKPRGVLAGGGNVMVTPLSPTLGPAGKAVAQIMIVSKGSRQLEVLKGGGGGGGRY